MTLSWKNYPTEILQSLLQGSVGQLQLGSLAESALNFTQHCPPEHKQHYFSLAGQMLQAIWEGRLLDAQAAHTVLQMHKLAPQASVQVLSLAKLIHSLDVNREKQQYENFLELGSTGLEARPDFQGAELERHLFAESTLPQPLQQGLLADVCLVQGNTLRAIKHYKTALRAFPSLRWRERLGNALYVNGQKEEALAQWQMVLEQRPWHVTLQLKAYDVLHGRDVPGELPQGQGAILLYTWNKADSLHLTLQALAESDLGNARIIVFDNGCTDASPQIIRTWRDKLGERMHSFRAPCNIGAPAARNWLLSMPQTQDCDWLVFLDDDALVPKDWLRYFGAAMGVYPQHPVYGCRVVDHDATHILQSADLHLRQGSVHGSIQGGENGEEPSHMQRFTLSELHLEDVDLGSFSYMRPCVSVTGCCHLFRREAFEIVGGFDLAFSPSQYDDLEHDIRLAGQNMWPVYQGHLCVKHMRKSGKQAGQHVASSLAAWANLFKLQTKYTHENYERIRLREHQILLHDLLQKSSRMIC